MLQPQFLIAILMVMLALAVACWADTAPTVPAASDSIETARRDLKGLSAAERELATRNELKKAEIPALVLTPAPGAARPAETATPPTSGERWLADALLQTDLERSKAAPSDDRFGDARNGLGAFPQKSGERPQVNPLDNYLTQWLSPRDQALLKPADTNSALRDASAFSFDANSGQSHSSLGGSAASVTPSPFSTGTENANPYLEPTVATPALSQTPFEANTSFKPVAPALAPANLSQEIPSPVAPTENKTQVQPAAGDYRQPTAPLVNDQKYFPQLRRF